jgi:hypothetical protein
MKGDKTFNISFFNEPIFKRRTTQLFFPSFTFLNCSQKQKAFHPKPVPLGYNPHGIVSERRLFIL